MEEEDVLSKISRISKITKDSPENETMCNCLRKLYRVHTFKMSIYEATKVSFDKEKSGHLGLLNRFWSNLMPIEVVPPIPDKRWDRLGFQGTDPSTDFRGMGLHGLQQLSEFSKKPSCITIWQHSLEESKWFPFAVVGINISSFLVDLLKLSRIDPKFLNSTKSLDEVFKDLYQLVFETFDHLWMTSETRDIMDFPRIFELVKQEIHNNL